MVPRRAVLILIAMNCIAASRVTAQQDGRSNVRDDFWIGFGAGVGSAAAACGQSCTSSRDIGLSGYLRLGGTVSQQFLLGAESIGYYHSEQGIDESLGFLSFVSFVYPFKSSGLYIKLGLGWMSYYADDGIDHLTADGLSGTTGIGYEIRTGAKFSVVPYISLAASAAASFRLNNAPLSTTQDITVNIVQLGLGVTWH